MIRQPLGDDEFRWFSDWLNEEFGLRYGPEKRDILRARLEPRRAELGFDTFEQLYFHLRYSPDRDGERRKLIPHLTNNESYFFRESAQLDVLRDGLLREVRERAGARNRHEVRVMSAGCAAGEEAYTLAMVAEQSRLFAAPWRVRVTGLDLDPDALERAQAGTYGANAFRRIDPAIREEFFSREGDDRWRVVDRVRRHVEFASANLSGKGWVEQHSKQDIIFCRNVLIYFSDDAIRTAAEAFYEALDPGGYLFLGHAETLSRVPTRFETVRQPGAIFYRRPEAEGE
jgi:chemotaxis protein methyltransferase CheR